MGELRASGGLKRLSAYLGKDFTRLLGDDIRLSALWQRLITEPLARHVRPLTYKNGRLVVQVASPAWANRVRQQQSSLCQALRGEPYFKCLVDISVRVVPVGASPMRSVPPPPTRKRFSPETAALLKSVARDLDDSPLKAAFERLASTAGGGSSRNPR